MNKFGEQPGSVDELIAAIRQVHEKAVSAGVNLPGDSMTILGHDADERAFSAQSERDSLLKELEKKNPGKYSVLKQELGLE